MMAHATITISTFVDFRSWTVSEWAFQEITISYGHFKFNTGSYSPVVEKNENCSSYPLTNSLVWREVFTNQTVIQCLCMCESLEGFCDNECHILGTVLIIM